MRPSTQSIDVIIIGGGILGLLTARELSASGARITLLEKQRLGQESSWAGGGILSPLYPWRAPDAITALCRWSQSAYPALAEELREKTRIDPEWTRSGMLIGDCEDLETAVAWCEAWSVIYDRLDDAAIFDLEPALCITPCNPLFLPDIAQVRNPRLLTALQVDLSERGVRLLENHEVIEIEIQNARVQSIATPHGRFSADCFIIAAGAWSERIDASAASAVKVAPVKGQMLIFNAPPGLLRHIVMNGGHYLIPRRDGKVLAGSTVEYTQFDKRTTETAYEVLTEFAYSTLPDLRKYPIECHWAGLRPGSPEGIPWIGQHPDVSNLFFNCGHFRNGFVMAPASARLLTDLMLKRPPIVRPENYQLIAKH